MGHGNAEFPGQRAHLLLLIFAQRQQHPLDLIAPQAAEHVALVVGGHALEEHAVPGAGVMACGHEGRAQTIGAVDEAFELHRGVAQDAGVGRFAAEIGLGERPAHLLLQLAADVPDGQRHGQVFRRRDCVGPGGIASRVQIEAEDLVPRALQKPRRHGGIHAARKAQYHLRHVLFPLFLLCSIIARLCLECKLGARVYFRQNPRGAY